MTSMDYHRLVEHINTTQAEIVAANPPDHQLNMLNHTLNAAKFHLKNVAAAAEAGNHEGVEAGHRDAGRHLTQALSATSGNPGLDRAASRIDSANFMLDQMGRNN